MDAPSAEPAEVQYFPVDADVPEFEPLKCGPHKFEALAITGTVLSLAAYIPIAVDLFLNPNRQVC